MTRISRRPAQTQPVAYDVSKQGADTSKKFNQQLRYSEGFRYAALAAGSNTQQNIQLNSPGKMLLGLTIIPATGSDIADTQISLTVNNNVVIKGLSAQNTNPNFVGSMIFFPAPQHLFGNDIIQLNIDHHGASPITVTANLFYVPRA